MSILSGILYFLFFAVVLPGELLWWGGALNGILEDSFLAKRLDLSPLAEMPPELFLVTGILALWCMIRAVVGLSRRSHAADPLLFGAFPLYVFSSLIYFRLVCAAVVIVPLVVLCAAAVWHAYRPEDRPAFFLPRTPKGWASPGLRLQAAVMLSGILLCAGLIFQEGIQLWLFVSPWTRILIFLPLLGILLPAPGQLREYICSSLYALLLCGIVYGTGPMVISDTMVLADYELSVTYIFLLLILALAVRPALPKIRNLSLLVIPVCFGVAHLIVPAVCSPRIITCSVYVLYLLTDNRRLLHAFLLRLSRRTPPWFAVRRESAALAWGISALLAAYLTGPDYYIQILTGLGAVFVGAMLRVRLLNDSRSDHIVLRNFPYAMEIFLLVLTGIACSPLRETSILSDEEARKGLMIVLSSFAAAACLMQTVWFAGELFGKYSRRSPSGLLLAVLGNAGVCFLMILLFFLEAPASILLGYFFVLSGILRIRSSSSRTASGNLGLTTGWVLIAIGQFIFVSSSKAQLPMPEWTPCAAIAGGCAIIALYITWLFDFYCRKKRKPQS